MSINAYFIKKIEYDNTPTFNINWNTDFMECFLEYCTDGTNEDFNGFIEIDYDNFSKFKNQFNNRFPDEIESISSLFRVNNLWSVSFICF